MGRKLSSHPQWWGGFHWMKGSSKTGEVDRVGVAELSIAGIDQEPKTLSEASDRLSNQLAIGQSVIRITRSRIDSWS